jgi:hypothetical protein
MNRLAYETIPRLDWRDGASPQKRKPPLGAASLCFDALERT